MFGGVKWLTYDPATRLQQGGPDGWLAAVRRAGLIAMYSRSYGQSIDEREAVDLLALLLYVSGPTLGGPDEVDLDRVRELVAEDSRHGEHQLYEHVADGLRQAGHVLDASSTPQEDVDPVVAAWSWLDLEPADPPGAFSEFSSWMVHPRGSTPLGRAAGTVRHWLLEQARPHARDAGEIRDFGETVWNPPGPRLHVHVPVTDAVRALAEVYAPVLHAWRHVVTPVDPRFLHLTLAWQQVPVTEVTDDQRQQLHEAVAAGLAKVGPGTLTVGRAVITRHGAVLDVGPDDLVWGLVNATHTAFDTVFGGELPGRSWPPHIALAYAHTSGAAGGLAHDLAWFRDHFSGDVMGGHRPSPVELPMSRLLVVDQDTYAPGGLAWTNEHLVDPAR